MSSQVSCKPKECAFTFVFRCKVCFLQKITAKRCHLPWRKFRVSLCFASGDIQHRVGTNGYDLGISSGCMASTDMKDGNINYNCSGAFPWLGNDQKYPLLDLQWLNRLPTNVCGPNGLIGHDTTHGQMNQWMDAPCRVPQEHLRPLQSS